MAKLGSPNLHFCDSVASPRGGRPQSAGSVCQTANRWPHEQQQQQVPGRPGSPLGRQESPRRGSQILQAWHRQQPQSQPQQQQLARSSLGVPAALQQQHQQVVNALHASSPRAASVQQVLESGAAAAAAFAASMHGDMAAASAAPQQDTEQQQQADAGEEQQQGEGLSDEVLLYGELMTALKRAGGSLRAETILEQLLQELGAARAALSSERGEGRAVRARLDELEGQHAGCKDTKTSLQVRSFCALCSDSRPLSCTACLSSLQHITVMGIVCQAVLLLIALCSSLTDTTLWT